MKLLILGGTGKTGQQLVTRALEQQHDVTVLVRDPSKLQVKHEKLRVIEGNVLDKDVLLKALKGQDVVLSALGKGKSLRSSNLISNATGTLITAMNETGIKRLIFESGFGAGETFKDANFLQRIIFRTFLNNIYGDKANGEKMIRSSSLDWTLVYPVVLTNGPFTGKYQVGEKLPMKGMPKISRADVADFMLRQLDTKEYLKKGAVLMS